MSSPVDVLIIGAGPTGLMLACQLSLYSNISFRIIDKNASSTKQSRALVIHARSLELFSQLNLVDKVLSQGNYVNRFNIYFKGQYGLRLDFLRIRQEQKKSLLTKYPYVLFLEQPITEQILETYLNEHNIYVERNSEVIDLIDIDNNQVQVNLANNQIIQTKYICACDGARSIVRHKLELPFNGQTYPESLFLADCKVDNIPINKNEAAIYSTSNGLIALFPIINDRYRIIGTIQDKNSNISIDNITDILKNRTQHYQMTIHDCKWISKYHSHHRHIDEFRYKKHYFLLGDAAHIHSPLGGQGMNTGLQDAHNLAWKLAFVLIHNANDYLLDTYHNERYNNAKKLVHTTDRAFAFMSSSNWLIKSFRLYLTPYICQFIFQPLYNYFYFIRKKLFLRLSQLDITYCSSKIYDYGASAGDFHRNIPIPGDRFPYIIYNSTHYHLVIFENKKLSQIKNFIEFIKEKFSNIIQIHYEQEENLPLNFQGAFLIRPDGYIAYRTNVYHIKHFKAFFDQFFLK
jgi:2-polyprenyl-6-methoxyphenol hydroxylase-like FAD-dependent oxidoreductase